MTELSKTTYDYVTMLILLFFTIEIKLENNNNYFFLRKKPRVNKLKFIMSYGKKKSRTNCHG